MLTPQREEETQVLIMRKHIIFEFWSLSFSVVERCIIDAFNIKFIFLGQGKFSIGMYRYLHLSREGRGQGEE